MVQIHWHKAGSVRVRFDLTLTTGLIRPAGERSPIIAKVCAFHHDVHYRGQFLAPNSLQCRIEAFTEGLPERSDKGFRRSRILLRANTILHMAKSEALQSQSAFAQVFKSIERNPYGLEDHLALGSHVDVFKLFLQARINGKQMFIEMLRKLVSRCLSGTEALA